MNCEHYKTFLETWHLWKNAKTNIPESTFIKGKNEQEFTNHIDQNITKAHVFNIDDTTKKLLLLTDSKKILRPPYPQTFLDLQFTKNELETLGKTTKFDNITGILITDNPLRITTLTLGKDQNTQEDIMEFHTGNINEKDKFNLSMTEQESQTITNLTLSFLHLLNTQKTIIQHTTIPNNLRRIKKGQHQITAYTNINLNSKLHTYIHQKITTHGLSQAHWVRGYYRHLQNKRYHIKKTIYINPFIRGHTGTPTLKHYNIKQ